MPAASVASSSGKTMSPPLFTSDFDSELFEVLFETNLLQYYHNFAVDLKIYTSHDLRNLTDSELERVGLNSLEIRRLRRVVKKESGPRSFFRLKKKFSFRAPSRTSFDASGDRLSLFTPSHSGTSQDDSSSIFRGGSNSASSLRNSARALSLTHRCGPAPPLVALLDPDLVTLIPTKILGEGEFATVYQGILRKDALSQDKDGMVGCMGLSASIPQSHVYRALASDFVEMKFGDKSSKLLTVAIKKFAPNCLGRPLHVFLQHVALLSDLRHPNLLHVFGCYTDEYCQPNLVSELASLRSLIDVFSDPNLRLAISPMHLCRYAEQIASAMAYLEKRRVVHGDLACRNVMLSNVSINGSVKVGDYGLLKALGVLLSGNGTTNPPANQTPPSSSANSEDANSTSTDHSKLRLPVAWCAPETLRAVEMASSSDVWSYGVTLWEMFSYGEQPWSQLSATEILDAVDAPCGQRLAQPDFCPRDYYEDVMLRCWRHDANDRPTFAYLEQHMPLVRPDQVQTVKNSAPILLNDEPEEDFSQLLSYSKGEILTVLDKRGKTFDNQTYWKGVTSDGCLGYFCASDVVFYTDLLVPSSGGESAILRIAPTPPLQISHNHLQSRPLQHQAVTAPAIQEQPQGYLVISPPPVEDPSAIYQGPVDHSLPNQTYSDKHPVDTASSIKSEKSMKMPNETKKHRFGGVIPSIVSSKVIDSSMISLPKGDLRHIGHIGFDGAVSGHVDFIAPGIERVCIGSSSSGPSSQGGTLPKPANKEPPANMKRNDSFEDGFKLPDLSLESEVTAMISNIRLSDYLVQPPTDQTARNEPAVLPKQGSTGSLSQTPLAQVDSTQMRQPRQPSGLLSGYENASPPPLTMAFAKQTPIVTASIETASPVHGFKELKITSNADPMSSLSLSPRSPTSTSSPPSSDVDALSPRPTANSITTSSPITEQAVKSSEQAPALAGVGSQNSLSSWRYVDSPHSENAEPKFGKSPPQSQAGVTVTVSSSVPATSVVTTQVKDQQPGLKRASIVTADERNRVYDEVRQKCGHPLLMSDCLRAVSYTQGNIDAAVKFLKLQYLASHRVAEVERCKNALVACDWEVERALDMLRLRSTDATPAATASTSFLTNNSPSDAVNV